MKRQVKQDPLLEKVQRLGFLIGLGVLAAVALAVFIELGKELLR